MWLTINDTKRLLEYQFLEALRLSTLQRQLAVVAFLKPSR